MTLVTVPEAAARLGIAPQTVKRRLKRGELHGQQQATPQGFVWLIEVPEDYTINGSGIPGGIPGNTPDAPTLDSPLRELVAMLQTQVEAQQEQLEAKDKQLEARAREVQELHVLLQQAQAQVALPAPRDHRPWWRRVWQRRE